MKVHFGLGFTTRLIGRAIRLRAETKQPLTYNELVHDELTDEQVAQLHLMLDEYQTAFNAVVKAVGEEVVRRHNARGKPLSVDGFLVTTKLGYSRERCIDTAGFTAWALENPGQVIAAINPNNLRFGSLPPAVRSTFFEKENVVKPDAVEQASAIPLEVLNK